MVESSCLCRTEMVRVWREYWGGVGIREKKNCPLYCRLENDSFEWVVGDMVAEGN